MATYPNLDFQNFYETTLSNDLAIGATDVFLTIVPTPTEGFLTIDPEGANPEIIWYSSKTSSKVVCPALGRGFDGTTAQAWTSGTKVIMAPVAETQRQIIDAASALTTQVTQGWITPSQTVGAVTYNGNRNYTLTMSADVSATLSPGMRVRTTRTVTAPTQCTSLNGTTQYYSRASASVTGMTFTDDFVVSAWVKLNSYGAASAVASRFNGTSGWLLYIDGSGRVLMQGNNAGSGNYSYVLSYQSVPLNKWVHITAQLDMSSFTASTTTSYVMIDGVDVPAQVIRAGTNPTALVQAGNLEIGTYNGGNFFPGKIAQVAIFSAKVTQATMRGYISQGLAGTETSLISAYSFNNSINDLNTTNANNLTANGSAVATAPDSPFTVDGFGTVYFGLQDYGIIQRVVTTSVTVQVPEGCTIPTSGGVSAISYSTQKAPYGMPISTDKWEIGTFIRVVLIQNSPAATTWYNMTTTSGVTGGFYLTIPIGIWDTTYSVQAVALCSAAATTSFAVQKNTLSTSSSAESDRTWQTRMSANNTTEIIAMNSKSGKITTTSATPYYLNSWTDTATTSSMSIRGTEGVAYIVAQPAML